MKAERLVTGVSGPGSRPARTVTPRPAAPMAPGLMEAAALNVPRAAASMDLSHQRDREQFPRGWSSEGPRLLPGEGGERGEEPLPTPTVSLPLPLTTPAPHK